MKLSVVIPTHRRPSTLAICLEHLQRQTVVSQMEVIVVGDGHDDNTARLFARHSWSMPVTYFEIDKSQQGAARNAGVARASGEFCLFIGDDIFLESDACERHLQVYASGKPLTAVLGHTTWDPAVGITPVMQWLERSGWQFGYPMISRYAHDFIPENIQHRFTYTSHISLPLSIAKNTPFRTDVHLYGWEDIEWGMRLKSAGVRLFYERDARALHHHRVRLEESLHRMEVLGESVMHLNRLIPGFDRVPTGGKLLVYKIAALFPTMAGRHRRAFLTGMKK